MTDYFKYHGLGNDYLVMEPKIFKGELSEAAIRLICDRHLGVGSDGILWGPIDHSQDPGSPGGSAEAVPLRIFNPDGSEAEKSGNGLRIFARHLWSRGLVKGQTFEIATIAGVVRATIRDSMGESIAIEMGQVRFNSEIIPMMGPHREVLREELEIENRTIVFTGVNVGNPHCVIMVDNPSEALAREIGPQIENHPVFPNRTNVQFVQVEDEHRIRISIWERGAGYTTASGSSSCAAAGAACRLGLAQSPVTVSMEGGELEVAFDAELYATLVGPVEPVAEGRFSDAFLQRVGMVRSDE